MSVRRNSDQEAPVTTLCEKRREVTILRPVTQRGAVMRPDSGRRTLSWIAWSLLILQGAGGAQGQEPGGCSHPPVPRGAAYVNVTGGLGEQSWGVRYVCDTGKQ